MKRRASIFLFLFAALAWRAPEVLADSRQAVVAGASVSFEDAIDARVMTRSLRLNRAQNVWNVDVTVTNASPDVLTAPLAVFVESWSNTSGPVGADGNDAADGKPFFVFPVQNETLPPGGAVTRTIALGVTGTRAPTVLMRPFSAIPGVTLALARTLDAAGQPLGGAQVEEVGPLDSRTYATDAESAVVTVGQGAGLHVWKFSADGYLPVWRSEALANGRVRMLVSPRMVKRSTNEMALRSGVENVVAAGEGVAIRFGASAFSVGATGRVTVVDEQTLPGLLPRGWSPLAAFSLELSAEPSAPAALTITAPANLGSGAVAVARFDETNAVWRLGAIAVVNGGMVTSEIPGSGAYAMVLRDVEGGTADLKIDEILPGAASPQSLDLVAGGTVTPSKSRASVFADLVTAQAQVAVTNRGGALPSGLVLVGDITERYQLRDGSRRFPPTYDEFFVGYRGLSGNPSAVEAQFPMRPLMLFGAEELMEATVRVDVSAPTNFSGGVFGTAGGLLVNGNVKARANAGDVASAQAVLLRELDPTNYFELGKNGAVVIAGAELTIGSVANGRKIALQFGPQETNGNYVLAKIVWRGGVYGLEPRERFQSDASGALQSIEPTTGAHLRGVNGSGQYLLMKVPAPVAVVGGTATEGGTPAGAAVATVDGQSWLSAADAAGKYSLVAPIGAATVRVRNFASGKEGEAHLTIPNDLGAVNADLTLGLPNLRVVSVTPAPGATNVSRIAQIVVNFSEAINPATLLNNLRLLGTNGQLVLGSVSLNLKNTSATFLPQAQLEPNTIHTIEVGDTISTPDGRSMTGDRLFTFTTETDQLNRPPPQLISYEPVGGSAGLYGTPGTADPEAPVILVNETTGQTATILSKVDGSFTNSIAADVDDILTAVLVNKNGTRTTLPVSKQIFKDGSVGLFNGGGILEAQSDGGPVQVLIEPGSIDTKTKFKVTPIPLALLQQLLATPPNGEAKLLGGMMLTQEGELKVGADISFPIDASSLNLTNAPEKASWALVTPLEVDGMTVYQIVDRMVYENGKLVTHSPPFIGALLKELKRRFKAELENFDFDKWNRRISKAVGLPDLKATAYNAALLPLLLSQGTSLIVQGKVASYLPDANGQPIPTTERLLPGATVTFAYDDFTDRPGRLNPGDTFTTSDSDGTYAIMFPINRLQENGFIVRATHPALPLHRAVRAITVQSLAQQFNAIAGDLTAKGPSLLSVVGSIATAASTITPKVQANLEFFRIDATSPVSPDADAGPPAISFTITPPDPGPGTNTTDGAVVTIGAADDLSVGAINLTLVSETALSASVTNNNVTVTPIDGSTTNIGTKFAQASYRVQSEHRANVVVRATATDNAFHQGTADLLIEFAGDRIPPAVNTNDTVHPRVLTTFPRNNATGFRAGQPVSIVFSEPIARTNMTNITSWLTVGSGAQFSSAELSRDGKELTVAYAPSIDETVSITINSTLTDLNGNAFDQDPVTQGNQTFSFQFSVANDSQSFVGMDNGGGAAMQGMYAYMLERGGPSDGAMVVYDISSSSPVKVGEIHVPGYPRDLALIPNYSYVMAPGGPVQTNTLVAVAGGKTGSETFQYLWIIDVTDPANPVRIAGANISLAISAVTKLKWAPPFLAYLESGADITSVSLVNLQAFLIGMSATSELIATFPRDGDPGNDANGDGDYTDAGDTLPLPERNPTEYFGKFTSFVDAESNRRIEDFDFDSNDGLVSIVMSRGFKLGTNGLPSSVPAKPAYRTVISGLGQLDPDLATLEFSNNVPKRVALFFQVLLAGDTNSIFRNLSIVSFSDTNALAVIDITDPLNPHELTRITLPTDQVPQTLNRRADGLLAVATMDNVYLFDPAKLLLPAVNGNPASLVGIVPGAGSGARSYVVDDTGINIVNMGARHTIDHTAPDIEFLSFPTMTVDPTTLAAQSWEALDATFRLARVESVLEKTRLFAQTNPTNPPVLQAINTNTLYYIRLDILGSVGGQSGLVDLDVESLNGAGQSLPNGGAASLPPHLAPTNTLISIDDTNYMGTNALPYPRNLKAVRLSNDKVSKYYNVFLAGPFVLTDTPLTSNQVSQVETQLPRAIVRTGRFLWAGLDSSDSNGPYSTNVLSQTVARHLQQGDERTIDVAYVAKPLIFIPGIAGSFIGSDQDESEYWTGLGSDSKHRKLDLSPANTTTTSVPDVIRWILPTPKWGNIYAKLINYLTNDMAYVEYDYRQNKTFKWASQRTTTNALIAQIRNNPDLFVYPYDWRKDNAQSAADLKEYVRLIRMFNPEVEQIDILAHSMGGLVARRFILDNPGVVDKLVTVGTPWLGAPKAIAALETGDFDDWAMNLFISKKTLRKLVEYFPGMHELLPSKGYFDIGGSPLIEASWDLNKNGVAGQGYSYDEYKQAMDNVLHQGLPSPVATNETFHGFSTQLGQQDDWRNDGTGVNYFHIYGVQAAVDTIGQVSANLKLRPVDGDFQDVAIELPVGSPSTNSLLVTTQKFVLDRRLEYVRVRGDGTVPALSASRVYNGVNFNAPGAMLFPIISPSGKQDDKSEHNGMLENTNVFALVRDILTGAATPATNAPATPPVSYRVAISNYRDGSVLVTDSSGENDDPDDVTYLGQLFKDLEARIISWITEDDGNRFEAQYEIDNIKSNLAWHTIDFTPADGMPFSVDVQRIVNGTATERFRWANVSSNLTPAQVKIDWNQQTVTLNAGSTFVDPTYHLTGTAAADATPPTLTLEVTTASDPAGEGDDSDRVTLTETDDTSSTSDLSFFIGYDDDGDGDIFNNIFYLLRAALVTATGNSGAKATFNPSDFAGQSATALGADAGGNATPTKSLDSAQSRRANKDCDTPTANGSNKLQDEKTAIVEALIAALAAANGSEWMLETNTANTSFPGVIYILEQGSGACFWKSANNLCNDCNEVFTAGVSDHDYEAFLPVFSNWYIGPRPDFANNPYDRFAVEGDWYFRPPSVSSDGTEWVYQKPGPMGLTEIRKPKINDVALTPANYISDLMATTAANSLKQANLPEAAKNLSVFSARAEQFENGYIDLDRPAETGADATGDVGMGRLSLLLKWILEGEYVTGVPGLTNPPPDLDQVFVDMQRHGITAMEGYEWGVYQEFAALSSGLMIRTANPGGTAAVKLKDKDYFYKIKKKQIKSAGKAGIRAAFGLLIGTAPPSGSPYILSRQDYKNGPYASFEEYVAKQAAAAGVGVFDTFLPWIDKFYKAKIADPPYLDELLHDDLEDNQFLAAAVKFCRFVQDKTEVAYQNALSALPANSPERISRQDNLSKVLTGFPNLHKPGLISLRTDPRLNFPVRIKAMGLQADTQVNVTMTGDMTLGPEQATVPKDGNIDIPKNSDDTPVFYVGTTQTSAQKIWVTVDPGSSVSEGNVANNWLGFYYYLLDLDTPGIPSGISDPLDPPSNLPTPVQGKRVDNEPFPPK